MGFISKVSWCVQNPSECAREAAPEVRMRVVQPARVAYAHAEEAYNRGRTYVHEQREHAGEAIERVAPAPVRQRVHEYREGRYIADAERYREREEAREEKRLQKERLREADERRRERQANESFFRERQALHGSENKKLYRSAMNAERLEKENEYKAREVLAKRKAREIKENNRGPDPIKYMWGEVKHAANIDRHKTTTTTSKAKQAPRGGRQKAPTAKTAERTAERAAKKAQSQKSKSFNDTMNNVEDQFKNMGL